MTFQPLTIAAIRNETPDLIHIELTAPGQLLSAYTTPGQYVQIKHGDLKPGYFALASGPKDARVELLIKRGSPLTDAIAAKRPGDALEVSAPQGKGYPINEARGRDVYLAGVGSGMAPLRALMRELLSRQAEFRKIAFLYGARTCDCIPFHDEVQSWAASNVELLLVCSQPAAGTWTGLEGYIQHVLKTKKPAMNADSAVFVCGMKPMVHELTAVFGELGLPPGRVFQNF